MKRILLLTASLIISVSLQAQPWLPQNNATINLEQIKDAYKASDRDRKDKFSEEDEEYAEGKDYHFDRWAWYWQSHLDEHGNLASPVRTYEEWKRYTVARSLAPKMKTTTNQSQWTFAGPLTSPGAGRGIGRINGIGFHPTDSNTFIVATAGGGAWRTTDAGVNWTCLTDNLPVLGTSDIDYNPLNPNTIFLCTGDRDASDTYSLGLLKSTDGGNTWNQTGLVWNRTNLKLANCLVINPQDTNSLTLATSDGIMKSYDGGSSWSLNVSGNFKQVLYNPADTNILYGAKSNAGAIYRSADGGQSWQLIISYPDAIRASIAVTPAAPNIVKAVFANISNYGLHGIYASSDTGKTFTRIFGSSTDCSKNILSGSSNLTSNTCSGQGWYDLAIAISPLDSNKIYVGGVNTYQSADGGYTWTLANQWTSGLPGIKVVHADKHFLTYSPINPTALYECNDGGIYKTYSPTTLWTDLTNGMGITQFYRIAVSNKANFVIAGAQDNGSKRVTFAGTWNELTGGDGMDCQINQDTATTFYTSIQYGKISKTTNGGGNFLNISDNIPGQPTGAWITPFLLHPNNANTIFAGYQHLYRSTNGGGTWTDISTTISSTDITRISLTTAAPNTIYILQGSALRYTHNLGNSWTTIPFGFSSNISDLLADPRDSNHIWVTYSGYVNTKVAEYTIGGVWNKLIDSLPNIPVQCITIDSTNRTIYIGTDIGVFYRDSTMTYWEPYNNGLPAIEVSDLGINYVTNEIWASTYGRGIWKSPKFNFSPNSINNLPLAMDVIKLAPNPSSGNFQVLTDNHSLLNEDVTIRLFDFRGAIVFQKNSQFDGGGKLSVNPGALAHGSYITEISKNGNIIARSKLILQ